MVWEEMSVKEIPDGCLLGQQKRTFFFYFAFPRYRTLTIYNVFLSIMADNTNTPGVAAPKEGKNESFNVLFRRSYSAMF